MAAIVKNDTEVRKCRAGSMFYISCDIPLSSDLVVSAIEHHRKESDYEIALKYFERWDSDPQAAHENPSKS